MDTVKMNHLRNTEKVHAVAENGRSYMESGR